MKEKKTDTKQKKCQLKIKSGKNGKKQKKKR